METACIILGKTGDIFSGLPIVSQNGNTLVTSKKYAPAVQGIPGLKIDVYDGHWQDLAGAFQWAKRKYPKVIVAQTHGADFPIQHTAPSWQYDQWVRAGCIERFGRMRLSVPYPAPDTPPTKPTILVAADSESSPFPHKDALFAALRGAFGVTHDVVDLSKIQKENIRDFLPMYEVAACLISIDTAHLHLSAAGVVPTIALVTNKPQFWHGSAWSNRFLLHVRYNDFEARREELLRTVRACVDKNVSAVPRLVEVSTAFRDGYNPSIIEHDGKMLMTFRYHAEKGKWRTALAIDDGLTTTPIKVPDGLESHSWEDGRLFTYDGNLHLSYVLSQYPSNPVRCVVGYSQLVRDKHQWVLKEHVQPVAPGNDFSGTAKNWIFFGVGKDLFAITGSTPQQAVIQLRGKQVVRDFKTPMPGGWNYGEVRGGAIVRQSKAIRFFHSKTGNSQKYFEFRYHIGKAEMEMQPPFKTLFIDPIPVISGNEMWTPACAHWKPNVVFPGGAVMRNGKALLAVGWNDCRCALLEVAL